MTKPLVPAYELRARGDSRRPVLEVWQLPSHATPRLSRPELAARLQGRPLELLENSLGKRLARMGARGALTGSGNKAWPLAEDNALTLALLFRALSGLRNLDRIRAVHDFAAKLEREEAAYWLGMALYRKNPRRILAAFRMVAEAS